MIYIQPTTNELVQDLLNDEYANWSYEGASAIVEFLEEIYCDGNDDEWDRVEIRCYYSEYKSFEELKADYDYLDDEELKDKIIASGESFIIVFEG